MATWKKLLVSGSNISQLANDAGYLTSVTAQTAFVTASFGSTHLIADSSQGQLNFASSSGAGLLITANSGNDTITFDLDAVPNASLANDGITIAGNDTSLGGSITAATILSGTDVVSSSAQIDHDATTNFVAGEHFLQSAITTVGTVTSGNVTAILPSGVVSGSAQIDHDATTNFVSGEHFLQSDITTVGTVTSGDVSAILPAGSVSGSISSPSQGTISINGNSIDLGVQTGDSPQFTNLVLTGDLTVEGTQINAQVANLDVEDRFILLNSGSAVIGDSGIVFGGANGVAQSGAGLFWDASYNSNDGRLAIINTINSDATGDQTPSYHIAGVYEGTQTAAATAQADHVGNILVSGSGEIFIYV